MADKFTTTESVGAKAADAKTHVAKTADADKSSKSVTTADSLSGRQAEAKAADDAKASEVKPSASKVPAPADKAGKAGKAGKKEADPNAAVNDAIENLREALLESGMDEGTVDAKLHSVRPAESSIVGNFADLQRMGAQLVHEEGGIADAVLPPAEPPTENEVASAGEVK